MRKSPPGRFKDISIAKKLYMIVGAMAILIITELLVLWFSIHTLSAVRAFIGAEGLWSKAQKDALYQLGKYHQSHNDSDYTAFQKLLAVPTGDHKARMELMKEDPDLDIVRQGFREGRIHPDDIDGMIKVVRKYNGNRYISKALGYWGQGDSLIAVLVPLAAEMQQQISSGSPSKEKLEQLNSRIAGINEQLTTLEDSFSFVLGEGARWLENLILKILFIVALTVEITGLVLTVMVTRSITRGLGAINKATAQITKGKLDERATVFSQDEIGQVADSVNRMAEQLIVSNKRLESFAHVSSHDLQEPLRKVMVFTDILQHELGTGINDKSKVYMQRIIESVSRMQRLVDDILQFAGVNAVTTFSKVDLNTIMTRILSDLEISIAKTNAKINIEPLPEIEANATQIQQLFQNLLSNALKFTTGDPDIHISAEILELPALPGNCLNLMKEKGYDLQDKFVQVNVKDNGIGFDEKYLDRMFIEFEQLNSKKSFGGSGIGLAICHKITANHKGFISAKSTPGQGATFMVILPMKQLVTQQTA
ncbi:MAG TPA: ATP-binding protein [Ferruginibacter sp.]|jgi:signal transduction histidine kinase|nr:ATP-binding protein [Ferruginibacter sp.]